MDTPRDGLIRSAPFQLERGDEGSDGLTLTGHGAVFNSWTEIDSWEGRFRERISPGAFKRTLNNNGDRVRLQFDHGQHPLIGSIPIGAIRELKEDRRGLFVEARLADNWLIQPVREAIDNGSIDGMSFRFSVVNETWDKQDTDLPERTITEVKLMELGPVVWPAYDKTDVALRSLADVAGAGEDVQRQVQRLVDVTVETRREVVRLLSPSDTQDRESTCQDELADNGTSEEQPAPPDDESRQTEDSPPTHEHLSTPIRRAQRPSLTREQLSDELRLVTARTAAASSRSR